MIREFIASKLSRVGLSDIKLKRTPLGDKIVISTLKPGLVVGRAGSTITALTKDLKAEFNLNNPQIELDEIKDPYKDPSIVAEQIVNSLERFGIKRFKGIGHKVISEVMRSGALGVEVLISGKVPSARAKTWRFYQGYLKKCGDISVEGVLKTQAVAKLKLGIIGVQVSILPGDVHLPDKIKVLDDVVEVVEVVESVEEAKPIELSDAQKELMENIKKTESAEDEKGEKDTKVVKKETKSELFGHSAKLNKTKDKSFGHSAELNKSVKKKSPAKKTPVKKKLAKKLDSKDKK